MSKGLSELRDHLFESIERLRNPPEGSMLEDEILRAKAINEVGKTIIDTGRLEVSAMKVTGKQVRGLLPGSEEEGPERARG